MDVIGRRTTTEGNSEYTWHHTEHGKSYAVCHKETEKQREKNLRQKNPNNGVECPVEMKGIQKQGNKCLRNLMLRP